MLNFRVMSLSPMVGVEMTKKKKTKKKGSRIDQCLQINGWGQCGGDGPGRGGKASRLTLIGL